MITDCIMTSLKRALFDTQYNQEVIERERINRELDVNKYTPLAIPEYAMWSEGWKYEQSEAHGLNIYAVLH